jgi:hypothetical protein
MKIIILLNSLVTKNIFSIITYLGFDMNDMLFRGTLLENSDASAPQRRFPL